MFWQKPSGFYETLWYLILSTCNLCVFHVCLNTTQNFGLVSSPFLEMLSRARVKLFICICLTDTVVYYKSTSKYSSKSCGVQETPKQTWGNLWCRVKYLNRFIMAHWFTSFYGPLRALFSEFKIKPQNMTKHTDLSFLCEDLRLNTNL